MRGFFDSPFPRASLSTLLSTGNKSNRELGKRSKKSALVSPPFKPWIIFHRRRDSFSFFHRNDWWWQFVVLARTDFKLTFFSYSRRNNNQANRKCWLNLLICGKRIEARATAKLTLRVIDMKLFSRRQTKTSAENRERKIIWKVSWGRLLGCK